MNCLCTRSRSVSSQLSCSFHVLMFLQFCSSHTSTLYLFSEYSFFLHHCSWHQAPPKALVYLRTYVHLHMHPHPHTSVLPLFTDLLSSKYFFSKHSAHLIARPSDNLQQNLLSSFNKCRQAPEAHPTGTISHCGIKGPEVWFFFPHDTLKDPSWLLFISSSVLAPSPVHWQLLSPHLVSPSSDLSSLWFSKTSKKQSNVSRGHV